MIEAVGLTKSYGSKTAVYDLTFQVQPGSVTGFLGPNGAGKSTTMRMILGLDTPTSGHVTVAGQRVRALRNAPRTVGALLDAGAKHGGRSARTHLLSLAQLSGLPASRVDEVLEMVGLSSVANKRSGGFSLGMGQRLGIAAALLGDPRVLLFDEPVNGLDPEGIRWVRDLMKQLASEGRTVFVSSHLMSEMALTAERLIVIGRGQLMADMSVKEFIDRHSTGFARVRVPDGEPHQYEKLLAAVAEGGGATEPEPDGAIRVTNLDLSRISDLAHAAGVRLWELSPHHASLEEAYMRLTQGAVDFATGPVGAAQGAAWAPQGAPGPMPGAMPPGPGPYGAPPAGHGPPAGPPPAGPYGAPPPAGGPYQGFPPGPGFAEAPPGGAPQPPPYAAPSQPYAPPQSQENHR